MKKLILSAVAAVCVASCCFAACNTSGYDDLNSKLDINYKTVRLEVTDTYDEQTSLISNYDIKFSEDRITVNYVIERFAEISLDSSSETVTVKRSGTAVIKDGKVVEGDLNISGVLPGGLDFKEEYFENAELNGTSLTADVKNAPAFFGTEIVCTDMKVNASFGEVFDSIAVTYKAENGNRVRYAYEFSAR